VTTFYLDHDVSAAIKTELAAQGHDVIRTRDLGLERADDATQLFRAAQAGYVLVTHNERDYKLLQRAWRLWPAPFPHFGILIIPQQRWTAVRTAEELDRFVQTGQALQNELFWWTNDRGWVRFM
jgi:hypothetical protein